MNISILGNITHWKFLNDVKNEEGPIVGVVFVWEHFFFHLENFRYNQPSTTTSGIAPTSSMPVWGVNQNEISHYLAARLNGSPLSNERKHIISLQPGLLRSAELSWVEPFCRRPSSHRMLPFLSSSSSLLPSTLSSSSKKWFSPPLHSMQQQHCILYVQFPMIRINSWHYWRVKSCV